MEKSVELKAELLEIFSLLNYIAYGQKIMSKIVRKIRCCFCNIEHQASCYTVDHNWVFVLKILK